MPSSLRISEASTTDLVHFESLRIDDEMLEFEEVKDASGVATIAAELAENRGRDLLHRVEIVEHLCGHVDRYRGTRRQRLRIQLSHSSSPHTIPPAQVRARRLDQPSAASRTRRTRSRCRQPAPGFRSDDH